MRKGKKKRREKKFLEKGLSNILDLLTRTEDFLVPESMTNADIESAYKFFTKFKEIAPKIPEKKLWVMATDLVITMNVIDDPQVKRKLIQKYKERAEHGP